MFLPFIAAAKSRRVGKFPSLPLYKNEYALVDVEILGSRRSVAGVAKEARRRGVALFYSRRAGGDSLGSPAGVLSHQRRFAAGDRRAAPPGIALFVKSFLVAAGASVRRPEGVGRCVHAGNRGRALRSTVRERRRRGLIVLLLILALTTLSATQDVAIDSYSVGLIRREEEGAANGVRASAYRVALVCAGGGLVFLAAVVQWNSLFIIAGAVFALLGFVALMIPRLSLPEEAREHWLKGFIGWAGTWRMIPLVLFC